VRFPVFANQLGGADATEVEGPEFTQQALDLFAIVTPGALQLLLGETLQEPTAGLAKGLGPQIEAIEESIGNGDHYLGHRMSIYGIARRQSWHD
jgi:hypothetical protein